MTNVQKGYAFAVVISLLCAACSTQNSFRTLSFFFDDVPNPGEEKESKFSGSLDSTIMDSLQLTSQTTNQIFTFHQPYLKKGCASCHNKGRMGSLKESQPDLCYQCHPDFKTKISFEHGPVNAGFCNECHDPHKAQEEKLLLLSGPDLCLQCHTSKQIAESEFHNISEEKDCSACHNPHGSNNHSLLSNGSCYKCHDDFKDIYKVLHGPVAGGFCSSCHTIHTAKSANLLALKGFDLCFSCHDSRVLLNDETHSYIEDSNCTECHNPHGGEDRFMFK